MKYKQLFSLRLTHTYYADGRATDFVVRPTAMTSAWLRNQRCLLKPLPDGAQILVRVDNSGKPFISMEIPVSLSFDLLLQNQAFLSFTDMSGIPPKSTFTNAGRNSVTELKRANVDDVTPPDAFARIVVQHKRAQNTLYTLPFVAKQVKWLYIVLSSVQGAAFTIEGEIEFTASTSNDELAQTLTADFPDLTQYRFTSKTAIALKEGGYTSFKLLHDGEPVIEPLPTPAQSTPNGTALYRVIRYLATPTPA